MSYTSVGLCLTFLLLLLPNSLKRIGEQNTLIQESKEAFAEGNMELAVAKQKTLIDLLEGDERQSLVRLNLALSYQRLEEKEEALRLFNQLLSEANVEVASIAANQLGLMQAAENEFEEALGSFRYALIKNHENETARYNYELLKRWMEENPPSDDQQDDENQEEDGEGDDQDQDQQGDGDEQDQDEKSGEGEEQTNEDEGGDPEQMEDERGEKTEEERESEEASDRESDLSDREKRQEQLKERLEQMNLTPEQAAQILEAMNAAEQRFIQQNRKKPTQRPDSKRPDW
ncbi:MAG: hypothetical protein ACXIT9_01415 [Nitritalea sp.]